MKSFKEYLLSEALDSKIKSKIENFAEALKGMDAHSGMSWTAKNPMTVKAKFDRGSINSFVIGLLAKRHGGKVSNFKIKTVGDIDIVSFETTFK